MLSLSYSLLANKLDLNELDSSTPENDKHFIAPTITPHISAEE